MKSYVGTKIINAESMTRKDFEERFHKDQLVEDKEDELGYHVVYGNPNNEYHSWSPKEVFEEAYRPISSGEGLLVKKTLLP